MIFFYFLPSLNSGEGWKEAREAGGESSVLVGEESGEWARYLPHTDDVRY